MELGCGSLKGEGGMLSKARFPKGSFLEGHLVWKHPFENLFPIFVHYSHLKGCLGMRRLGAG